MIEKYEDSRLYKLRHSAAHLMAQAIAELFPGVKLTIGPPVENGFYYDVLPPRPIREEDLALIEARMKELAKLDQRIERIEAADREDAKRIIRERLTLGGPEDTVSYKLQLLDAIPESDPISFYEQKRMDRAGVQHTFIDLCRGPHVESTKEIKAFKLMSIAGAFWRGDAKNEQLTRIYGTAFETKEELEAHLVNLEEAKKRDHRKLGKELGLFMFSDRVGTGLPLWLPKGAVLRQVMTDFLQKEQLKRGYEPVVTPLIASSKLFAISGHLQAYREKMYPLMEVDGGPENGGEEYALKPMNCPFHCEIFASQMRSYRDLPVRYAEFGTVHRYEQSGEVTGILRARGFTQDDAHLFVTPDQLLSEFLSVVDLMVTVLEKLGLTQYRARVGTRDPSSDKYVGEDDKWAAATEAIESACRSRGLAYEVSTGDAAFYGPKLDLIIKDALGREWQMGTVQVDYVLPERFELEYIGDDSKPHRPILIHRAPFGSLERMIGLLTEQYAGAFPLWLSPVQIEVLPVADRHNEAAAEIAAKLRATLYDGRELRVHVDERRETVGKKIRDAQLSKAPYMLIVGDKWAEEGSVGVRSHAAGDLGAMRVEAFLATL